MYCCNGWVGLYICCRGGQTNVYAAHVVDGLLLKHGYYDATPHQLGQVCKFFLHNCSCFSLVFVLSELVFEALYLRVALLRGKIQIGKLWLCPTKSWVAACLTCLAVIPVFSDKAAKVGTKLRCSAKNKIQIKLDFIPKWICTSQGPRPSCEEGREIEGPISGE